MSSELLLVLLLVGLTVSPAPQAPRRTQPKVNFPLKDRAWLEGVMKLMETGNRDEWANLIHPEATVLYNLVKYPTTLHIQSFDAFEYTNCVVEFVHTKGPRSAIGKWKCDFKNKKTGDTFKVDATEEYDFDKNDKIKVLRRKLPPIISEKIRSWTKTAEKEEL
eukprot:TRINITY_DN1527_c0_g1_i1.p1 TRINITY_DN1527_c0_g1~~TRINITY_DN1527_c0_g1_i1.p1  ORF type:complete len:163 (-),score=35.03 TRINITY_DN1527_c0_g1_i1:29-517(-)